MDNVQQPATGNDQPTTAQPAQSSLPDYSTPTEAARLENVFTYHAPKNDQLPRYESIRSTARHFAQLIDRCCPNSREKSLALTKLQEATQMANAAIAINE